MRKGNAGATACRLVTDFFTALNQVRSAGRINEIRGVSDRLGLFLQLGWDWPTVD
ncbi:hypothetical protein RM550_03160 [Streptomyces sp. DSM 41527]|uniref:Tn3 transposase DDE domain-containing protein n=1 Tax=Streptomyces mooreae TaxID=3075523 RepID=A0ABU2T3I6_9ACTN|nr:hypothetical protein [Streptomyces sp. DSM 41527]MDT0454740.1 hypothetical protein [Streptomyces sp. DSM 41527]